MRFVALLKTTRVKVHINLDSVSCNELICFTRSSPDFICPVVGGSTSIQATSFSLVYGVIQICICFHSSNIVKISRLVCIGRFGYVLRNRHFSIQVTCLDKNCVSKTKLVWQIKDMENMLLL